LVAEVCRLKREEAIGLRYIADSKVGRRR
jgi:hypothetical protein